MSIGVRRDYQMTAKLEDGVIPPPPTRIAQKAQAVLASLDTDLEPHSPSAPQPDLKTSKLEQAEEPQKDSPEIAPSPSPSLSPSLALTSSRLYKKHRAKSNLAPVEPSVSRKKRPEPLKPTQSTPMEANSLASAPTLATEALPKPVAQTTTTEALRHAPPSLPTTQNIAPLKPSATASSDSSAAKASSSPTASLATTKPVTKIPPKSQSIPPLIWLVGAISAGVLAWVVIGRKKGRSPSPRIDSKR